MREPRFHRRTLRLKAAGRVALLACVAVLPPLVQGCARGTGSSTSSAPSRWYQTKQHQEYIITASTLTPRQAEFQLARQYEAEVWSHEYMERNPRREPNMRPREGLAGRLQGVRVEDAPARVVTRARSPESETIVVTPNRGWLFLDEDGRLHLPGYSRSLTDRLVNHGLEVRDVPLTYHSYSRSQHKGGGGVISMTTLRTLRAVRVDQAALIKGAADLLRQQAFAEVDIQPEDAISRVEIRNADLRLTRLDAPDLRPRAAALVPADQVATVLKMVGTGGHKTGYVHRLPIGARYKLEVRHPQYQYTELTFTVPRRDSRLALLIGDRGQRVRVVFE